MAEQQSFKWRHFEAEIILVCVRWYLRDAEAAKRFFCKALYASTCSAPQNHPTEEPVVQPLTSTVPTTHLSAPRVINVDKNAAYPKAIADLKATGILPESVDLRQRL